MNLSTTCTILGHYISVSIGAGRLDSDDESADDPKVEQEILSDTELAAESQSERTYAGFRRP